MEQKVSTLAEYVANQVPGRSEFCPRKGFFRFISFHESICFRKPALMALAHWKLNLEDEYSDEFHVEIQVESLRVALDKKESFAYPEALVDLEIQVTQANYYDIFKVFVINWHFLNGAPKIANETNLPSCPTAITDRINSAFKVKIGQCGVGIFDSVDIADDYGDVDDYEGGY